MTEVTGLKVAPSVSQVAMSYGGQAGLNRPAVTFLGLKPVSSLLPMDALPAGGLFLGRTAAALPPSPPPPRTGAATTVPNPSYIANSSVVYSLDCAVAAWGSSSSNPVTIQGELLWAG